MATQEEYWLMGSAVMAMPDMESFSHRVRVGLCPRSQPFDESMESLFVSVVSARKAGIEVLVEKTRRGVPGFQNWGPSLYNLLADKQATHIFSAADDMIYPENIFERLVGDDKDVVSGVYRKGNVTVIEPANWEKDIETFTAHLNEGGVYESEFASGHTMLIKRHVIEKMVSDYPELAYSNTPDGKTHYGLHLPMIKDGRCYQDDWAFSLRARASGFTVWNDYGCRCFHWGGAFLGFPGTIAREVQHG